MHQHTGVPAGGRGEDAYIKKGKPLVAEGGNGVAQERDAEEDEEHLIGLGREDGAAVVLCEDVYTGHEEGRRSEVDGEGDGDVAHDV